MSVTYNPKEIENKWQVNWDLKKSFKVSENEFLKKYYLLEMFPYPSGKIHMGHIRVYTIGDVIARYKRMRGYNVLHPMGWDAFGMPAENAAISGGIPPAEWTYDNINHMRSQLKRFGFSYDWDREITTCRPEYYKWEQWLFIKMLKSGMAYRKESFVNWCQKCDTVLANEQVHEGRCWRCDEIIQQKKLWQWFLRISDYSDSLHFRCDKLVGWPEKVITMQKNWIGRKKGVEITFQVENYENTINVFTTRPDTLFGVTFISLAPKHPIVIELSKDIHEKNKLMSFVSKFSENNNLSNDKIKYEKEGIFTGKYCINPINGDRLPIYVVNFVLMEYGTGAIMSVPAHDQRDFEFAEKYNLPIKYVIKDKKNFNNKIEKDKPFIEKGILINSAGYTGLTSDEAYTKIVKYIEEKKIGVETINFRLKDWGISRQRYWGTPIPVIYCKFCGIVPVKENDLPVVLPEKINYLEKKVSNLSDNKDFYITSCPKCGYNNAKRETDTMDTFLESSWYFERFCSPSFDKGIFDIDAVKYWMPVDQYVGGIEHAILHLLYSRYFTRVLKKFGLVEYEEPFLNVLTQGMVCKETYKCPNDGYIFPNEIKAVKDDMLCNKCGFSIDVGRVQKMSKSKKNIADPDFLINKFGADTVRLFSLFAAPPEKDLEWNERGVEGSYRFLNRVWRLFFKWFEVVKKNISQKSIKDPLMEDFKKLLKLTHKTIKKVTQDIEDKFRFNTAISSIMELTNFMYSIDCENVKEHEKSIMKFSLKSLILLLYPMVPHISEELWEKLYNTSYLTNKSWPVYDEKLTLEDRITFVIQINGKLRARIKIIRDIDKNTAKKLAFSDNRIKKLIFKKNIKKNNLYYK